MYYNSGKYAVNNHYAAQGKWHQISGTRYTSWTRYM